jgi:hypothetical protein
MVPGVVFLFLQYIPIGAMPEKQCCTPQTLVMLIACSFQRRVMHFQHLPRFFPGAMLSIAFFPPSSPQFRIPRSFSAIDRSPPSRLLYLPLFLLFRNQTLRRRIRAHNLPLHLSDAKLRLQNPNHAQQPPRRVARLRTYAHPVPCARNVEPYVFPRTAVCVAGSWRLGLRVVGAEDFEGAGVAGSSGGCVRGYIG